MSGWSGGACHLYAGFSFEGWRLVQGRIWFRRQQQQERAGRFQGGRVDFYRHEVRHKIRYEVRYKDGIEACYDNDYAVHIFFQFVRLKITNPEAGALQWLHDYAPSFPPDFRRGNSRRFRRRRARS
jgi:hypothetical protein